DDPMLMPPPVGPVEPAGSYDVDADAGADRRELAVDDPACAPRHENLGRDYDAPGARRGRPSLERPRLLVGAGKVLAEELNGLLRDPKPDECGAVGCRVPADRAGFSGRPRIRIRNQDARRETALVEFGCRCWVSVEAAPENHDR